MKETSAPLLSLNAAATGSSSALPPASTSTFREPASWRIGAAQARWLRAPAPRANPVAAVRPVHFNRSRRETAEPGVRSVIALSSSTPERPVDGIDCQKVLALYHVRERSSRLRLRGRRSCPPDAAYGRGNLEAT